MDRAAALLLGIMQFMYVNAFENTPINQIGHKPELQDTEPTLTEGLLNTLAILRTETATTREPPLHDYDHSPTNKPTTNSIEHDLITTPSVNEVSEDDHAFEHDSTITPNLMSEDLRASDITYETTNSPREYEWSEDDHAPTGRRALHGAPLDGRLIESLLASRPGDQRGKAKMSATESHVSSEELDESQKQSTASTNIRLSFKVPNGNSPMYYTSTTAMNEYEADGAPGPQDPQNNLDQSEDVKQHNVAPYQPPPQAHDADLYVDDQ